MPDPVIMQPAPAPPFDGFGGPNNPLLPYVSGGNPVPDATPEQRAAMAQYFGQGLFYGNQTPVNGGDVLQGQNQNPRPVTVGEITNLLGMVPVHERGTAMQHAARLFGVGASGRAR